MIERRKLTRDVIGLIVSCRARRPEAQVACHCGHRPEEWYRIEPRRILITIPDPDLQVQAVAVRDAKPVGEEDEVEFAALERPRDVEVEVEVEKGHVVRRVTPNRVAVAHRPRNEEAAKVHLTHACESSA